MSGRGRRWPLAACLALAVGLGLGLVNRAAGFDLLNASLRTQLRQAVGVALAEDGRVAEAATWFQKALDANPAYAAAHANLGSALFLLNRTEEGLEQLRLAVRTEPENPGFRGQLANALVEQRRFNEAIEQLQAGLAAYPNNLPMRVTLGNALFAADQPAAAIEQYQEALRLDETYALAHVNLGRVLLAQGAPADAFGHFEDATRYDPDLIEAHLLAATALIREGRLSDAVDRLRTARQRHPSDPQIANDLAWHLWEHCPACRRTIGTSPSHIARQAVASTSQPSPNDLDTLAAAQAATGDFSGAVETMERALALADQQSSASNLDDFRRRLALYQARTPYVAQIEGVNTASQPAP